MSTFSANPDSAPSSLTQNPSFQTDYLRLPAADENDSYSSGISVASDEQNAEAQGSASKKKQKRSRSEINRDYWAKRQEIRRNMERDLAYFRSKEESWQNCERYANAWLQPASWLASQTNWVFLRPAEPSSSDGSGKLSEEILVQIINATGTVSEARLLSDIAREWCPTDDDLLAAWMTPIHQDVESNAATQTL